MKFKIEVTKEEAERIILEKFKEKFPKAVLKFEAEHRNYSSNLGTVECEIKLFEKQEEPEQGLETLTNEALEAKSDDLPL